MNRRLVVQCLFRHGDRVFVYPITDPSSGERSVRAFGGGMEAGETPAEAVHREMREELAADILDCTLLGTFDADFTWNGRRESERHHVFDARLPDEDAHRIGAITGVELNGDVLEGRWMSLAEIARRGLRILPEELVALLERWGPRVT